MSGISTHVLDTSLGCPAAAVACTLERLTASATWVTIASAATDADGRVKPLLTADTVTAGIYRLSFGTAAYFDRQGRATLYPEIAITFTVAEAGGGYHIPLLISPFGYSTYRGT